MQLRAALAAATAAVVLLLAMPSAAIFIRSISVNAARVLEHAAATAAARACSW